MILAQKTQFWNVLPWKLCGLAHWDTRVRQRAAAECIRLYDAAPEGNVIHHKLSIKLLSPGVPCVFTWSG
eukprot:9491901-Pyramimonas_sp.AAC.1